MIASAPGVIGFRSDRLRTTEHTHHALQITLGTGLEVQVRDDQGFVELATSALIIAPDSPHRLTGEACTVLLVEPESTLATSLSESYLGSSRVAALELAPGEESLSASVARILNSLAPTLAHDRVCDPRIERVLAWIDARDDAREIATVNFADACRLVHLSEVRFRHLFVEQVGIPWRRYLLWRKLQAAAKRALAGDNLTRAARDSGFSDSAHLSRTFRAMFGVAPSQAFE